MSEMVLFGALLGAGLVIILRALRPRPSLTLALATLDRMPDRILDGAPPPVLTDRIGRRLLSRRGELAPSTRRDLRVCARTPERHVAEKLLAALCGVGVPVALALLVGAMGGQAPVGVALGVALASGIGGWLLPDQLLRDHAKRRRLELRQALSSYLDLVNVVLAGGAGIETALEAAADAGDGWAFAELRAALARARVLRRSPWSCFGDLGDDLGVDELVELAASVRLAGEQGARIKASLAAKAVALRGHLMAAVEADAQSASERMALPTVLMFVGFLIFVGYPALAQILGGTGL